MYTHTHTHIESVVCVGGTPLVPLHTPSAHLCTPAVTGGPCLDWQRSSWINTGAWTAPQCGWHAGIFGHLTGIYKYKSNLHVPSAIAVVFAANTLSQKQRLKRIFGHLVKQLGILIIVRIRMPLNNQDGCLVLRDRWFTDPHSTPFVSAVFVECRASHSYILGRQWGTGWGASHHRAQGEDCWRASKWISSSENSK